MAYWLACWCAGDELRSNLGQVKWLAKGAKLLPTVICTVRSCCHARPTSENVALLSRVWSRSSTRHSLPCLLGCGGQSGGARVEGGLDMAAGTMNVLKGWSCGEKSGCKLLSRCAKEKTRGTISLRKLAARRQAGTAIVCTAALRAVLCVVHVHAACAEPSQLFSCLLRWLPGKSSDRQHIVHRKRGRPTCRVAPHSASGFAAAPP